MACGGCGRRRAADRTKKQAAEDYDLMGGYANLTNQQIKARLEVYKRKYCRECSDRYECDYTRYLDCKKNRK